MMILIDIALGGQFLDIVTVFIVTAIGTTMSAENFLNIKNPGNRRAGLDHFRDRYSERSAVGTDDVLDEQG